MNLDENDVWRYLNIAHPSSYNVHLTWNEEILHQRFLILNLTKQTAFHYKKNIHFYSCVSLSWMSMASWKTEQLFQNPYNITSKIEIAHCPFLPFDLSLIQRFYRIFDHKKGQKLQKFSNVLGWVRLNWVHSTFVQVLMM